MGECACTQIQGDLIITAGNATLTIDCYHGCRECAPLIGIDVRVFNKQGVTDWLDGNTGQTIEPNEYGGPRGQVAACLELFSIDDLADATDETLSDELLLAYGDIKECFRAHALTIVQNAIAKCKQRNNTKDTKNEASHTT